jgi:hypothetical protein
VQFRIEYGIYGSTKTIRNSVSAEFRKHPKTLSHRNVLRPLDGWNLKVKLSVEVGGKSLDFLPELLINTVHQNVIF